jgi:DNA-binding NarL/FixJ family response regulator
MASEKPRLRVLIADDNQRVVKSVSRLLAMDYDVVGCVGSCNELLETVQKVKPEIVVLDLSLSDGNSMDVCREITGRDPSLKVIVFSADDNPEIRDRAKAAGAVDFVDKLFADALLTAVRRLRA